MLTKKWQGLFAIAALAGTMSLTACSKENEEDRTLAAGMACLDKAQNATDADVCMAKLAGQTSPKSYLIRCSLHMVAQGFTSARIAAAFQAQNSNTGQNQTSTMLSYFVFSPDLTAHSADITYNDCQASGVKSMVFLASMFKVASLPASLAATFGIDPATLDPNNRSSFDPTAIKTAFENLYNGTNMTAEQVKATNETLGQVAVTAQISYCGAGSTMAKDDVCAKLNSAVAAGGGDPADIGRSLLNLLKQAQ